MKQSKIHICKFRLPIYNSRLWIVVCPSIIKSIDYIEDMMDHKVIAASWKGTTRAYTYGYELEGVQRFILFLKPTSKPGEIAHETKHLVNLVFRWNNVRLSVSNDESECYYLEYLVDKVHSTIKQYQKKYKPKLG